MPYASDIRDATGLSHKKSASHAFMRTSLTYVCHTSQRNGLQQTWHVMSHRLRSLGPREKGLRWHMAIVSLVNLNFIQSTGCSKRGMLLMPRCTLGHLGHPGRWGSMCLLSLVHLNLPSNNSNHGLQQSHAPSALPLLFCPGKKNENSSLSYQLENHLSGCVICMITTNFNTLLY